jgi:hypothetical protein
MARVSRVPRKCRRYRRRLAAAADRRSVVDLALRRHLRACAACRVQFDQHRTIGRALRSLPKNVALTGLGARPSGTHRRSKQTERGLLGLAAVVMLGAVGVGARRRA